jgi:hypothetical protein
VTTKLFAADVPKVVVDELVGHEGQGVSETVYNKGLPLKNLHAALSKIAWPEADLSRLYQR